MNTRGTDRQNLGQGAPVRPGWGVTCGTTGIPKNLKLEGKIGVVGRSPKRVTEARVCLFGMVLFVGVVLLQACGANPGNPLSVNVRNDTSEAVVLKACNGSTPPCEPIAYTATVSPGTATSTVQEPDGTSRPIVVTNRAGTTLGCLPFQFSKVPPPNLTINVSRMVPCGSALGTKGTGGRDWPFSRY
jgi:hypothetical protein